MSTIPASSEALPDDLGATLEVLARLIAEVQHHPPETPGLATVVTAVRARPQLATLPGALLRIYNEITAALNGIRLTRETIQHEALDHLRDTQERLSRVSNTTETVAMEMMNGLDRTLALVDAVEAEAPGAAPAHIAALRDELNLLFGHLQFQDIVAQQVHGITALLEEVDARMSRVADLLDHSLSGPAAAATDGPAARSGSDLAFNADARWAPNVDQSAVDAAFRARRPDATPDHPAAPGVGATA